MRRIAAAPALLLFLAGCAAAPAYRPPEPPAAPERFAGEEADAEGAEAALSAAWWREYGDPLLDGLVGEAVWANGDLLVAAGRVHEARTLLTQAAADLWPKVTADASAARVRKPPANPSTPLVNDAFSVELAISYEVDLWDRIGSRERAAVYDAEAYRFDAERAYHSLVAQVVQGYVNLRHAERKAELARTSVENDLRRAATVRLRYEAGLVSAMDLYLIEQTLAGSEGAERTARLAAATALHAVNVLVGRYPAEPLPPAEGEMALPGPVPAGMPASLLERRPDLKAAARRHASAAAGVEAAHGDRMPRLSLSAGLGRESVELRDLVIGDHTVWNVLGNLSYPLFNAGKLEAAEERAAIVMERARLQYVEAVRRGFRETEDALATERELRARRLHLERSYEMASRSLDAALDRYRRGLDNLIPTLNARQSFLLAESELVENRRALLANRAALHLALGGDFGHEATLAAEPAPGAEESR